jgi:hypothetical protein
MLRFQGGESTQELLYPHSAPNRPGCPRPQTLAVLLLLHSLLDFKTMPCHVALKCPNTSEAGCSILQFGAWALLCADVLLESDITSYLICMH